ncbi:MAG: hypothetical protein ACUVX8_06245 [Candidatus Zipacnadales bacterium]
MRTYLYNAAHMLVTVATGIVAAIPMINHQPCRLVPSVTPE